MSDTFRNKYGLVYTFIKEELQCICVDYDKNFSCNFECSTIEEAKEIAEKIIIIQEY